jgi:hypothetical protein
MSSTMDRSVAGLNSEQLYRKRALDRANQRASRARKKTRIQELEEEVLDLQQRLARSEDRVRQLQNSDVCLREIIDSARASLQMVEHHTQSPLNEFTNSETASRIASPTREMVLHAQPPDSGEAHELSPSAISNKDDPEDAGATMRAFTGASLDTQSEGVTLRDPSTGLSLELPFGSNDPMLEMWDEVSCKQFQIAHN